MLTVNSALATLKLPEFQLDRFNDLRTIELKKDYVIDLSRNCQLMQQKVIYMPNMVSTYIFVVVKVQWRKILLFHHGINGKAWPILARGISYNG